MSEIATPRRTRQLSGRLTDLQLRNLTTRDRLIRSQTAIPFMSWWPLQGYVPRWKFHFAGKEKLLPLGSYPEVGLAQAREDLRKQLQRTVTNIDLGRLRDAILYGELRPFVVREAGVSAPALTYGNSGSGGVLVSGSAKASGVSLEG